MALQYEFHVAGKRVSLKRRLPLKDGQRLPGDLAAMRPSDMAVAVPIMRTLIESWEFDGDPSDPAAWDRLDLFTEVWPLWKHVDAHLGERFTFDPKASLNGSSSTPHSETASTPTSKAP